MALINNKYFKSKNVKVFPASFRGNYENKQFDPEARLNSEHNLVHIGNTDKSYLIEWTQDTGTFKCVIGGYYFELYDVDFTDIKGKKLCIKTRPVLLKDSDELDSKRETFVLDTWEENTAYVLDIEIENDYAFTGISVEDDENGTAFLELVNDDGQINYNAYLPHISSGAGYYTEGTKTTPTAIEIGRLTTATEDSAFASGINTTASGIASSSSGFNTNAEGNYSHTEGKNTKASGEASHAEGFGDESQYTQALAEGSHAEGHGTIITTAGKYAHTEGEYTQVKNVGSHAEGRETTASGKYSHTEGKETSAISEAAHAEGYKTKATGLYAHAEGENFGVYLNAEGQAAHSEGYHTKAKGNYSHAEGLSTKAIGEGAHAAGLATEANGAGSHAEGSTTKAYSEGSHAEGYNTEAGDQQDLDNSKYAHAEGQYTKALGLASHAEGGNETVENGTQLYNEAQGKYSHVEGVATKAVSTGSHAEGYNTTADAEYAHTEGNNTNAAGNYSHAEGDGTIITSDGTAAHAEGTFTKASASFAHAEGIGITSDYTEAAGEGSHAEGYITKANSKYSHTEGNNTKAIGDDTITIDGINYYARHAEGVLTASQKAGSHAEGVNTTADAIGSHTEGYSTNTSGDYSHAEGNNTIASGSYSHAEGERTKSYGEASHAEGFYTSAGSELDNTKGKYAHAEGYNTKALGIASHTEGLGTVANNDYETVVGKYNKYADNDKRLFVVGNGTGDEANKRKNAFEIKTESNKVVIDKEQVDLKCNLYLGEQPLNKIIAGMLLDLIYPVGSIYTCTVDSKLDSNNTCPVEKLLGGKWERITGRFLYAAYDKGIHYRGEEDEATSTTDKLCAGDKAGSWDTPIIKHTHPITDIGHTHTITMDKAGSHWHPFYWDWNSRGEFYDLNFYMPEGNGSQKGSRMYGCDPLKSQSHWFKPALENENNNWNDLDTINGTNSKKPQWDENKDVAKNDDRIMDCSGLHNHATTCKSATTGIIINEPEDSSDGKNKNMPPYLCVYMWERTK